MTELPSIAPLENLPLFHRMAGRKAVVVGTSPGARWKAELLTAAGAKVERLDADWTEEQLIGAAIAVADIADRSERLRFANAAKGAGALVNMIDEPGDCEVQFGTIVNRSPVVIAISTGGAAPMLGQSIRTRIEAVLPPGLSSWAMAAKRWRPRLKQKLTDSASRRDFWRSFVAAAWSRPEDSPTEDDFDDLLDGSANTTGRVILINTDPGDAELLTLKAARAMQSATVILHDDAIDASILEIARREAQRIKIGAIGGGTSSGALMIELARKREIVVRISAGRELDKQVEIDINACRSAGIDVSTIPGIVSSI